MLFIKQVLHCINVIYRIDIYIYIDKKERFCIGTIVLLHKTTIRDKQVSRLVLYDIWLVIINHVTHRKFH